MHVLLFRCISQTGYIFFFIDIRSRLHSKDQRITFSYRTIQLYTVHLCLYPYTVSIHLPHLTQGCTYTHKHAQYLPTYLLIIALPVYPSQKITTQIPLIYK